MRSLRDFLSERIIFGLSVIAGYLTLATLILTGTAHDKGVSDTMQGVIIGALATSLTNIIASSFRTDKIDQQRAATADTAVTALAAATPAAPAPVQPVAVVNAVSDPVPVQQA